MNNKKRLWLTIIIALAVLAIGFYVWRNSGGEKIEYRVEKADRGEIVVSISATGALQAVTTVQVGSQVSGTISRLYADYNSVVREGQLLAQLDPTFLQATVNEQRANVQRAVAQVNEAERSYQRTKDLFEKTLVSQADMDAATTTLESARAGLKQAEGSLERAEVNLKYATIRAPISGVVISRDVDVGQTVAASLQAPTLFTIANDLRKMQVQANVDEADIGSVKEGQRVTFRVDAYPEEEFEGRVSQIRLAPIVTQNVVTYNVIIDVDNKALKLMPGMTATVTIEVDRREDVLRVPLQALRFTPPAEVLEKIQKDREAGRNDSTEVSSGTQERGQRRGGGGMMRAMDPSRRGTSSRVQIWLMENGKPKPVFVRKGIQNTRHAEVEGRLNEGDNVIVGAVGGTTTTSQQQQNPFMPQMPRGSRRGL